MTRNRSCSDSFFFFHLLFEWDSNLKLVIIDSNFFLRKALTVKLDPSEQMALEAWMKANGLTLVAAAKLMRVSRASVVLWCKGGGIRPSQLARLRPLISPYKTFDLVTHSLELNTLREKMKRHVESHPDLVQIHLKLLDHIEEFLSRN